METYDDSLAEVRRCVQALARSADEQRGLFPYFVCVPDELVLGLEEALRAIGGLGSEELLPSESAVLTQLDALLSSFSGEVHADLWLNEALTTDPRWETIRSHAREVLRVCEWPDELPKPSTAIYVGGLS
jgi:hypothetical protein